MVYATYIRNMESTHHFSSLVPHCRTSDEKCKWCVDSMFPIAMRWDVFVEGSSE